ncbi:MAG: biotin--[acetyl-CoA-carboxylase] ligase [Balneolales bacterium]|nr:biotin--[acetyl-CoA-carboxylase] ligase [Balneolales bacterium]
MFDPDRFIAWLTTKWVARPFHFFRELPSTNSWLKSSSDLETGTVVITDNQVTGRGQYDRKWVSEPGQKLMFSVVLRPGNPKQMHTITLVAATACAEVLQTYTSSRICIKWPNDIYCESKKIGGILVESSFLGGKIDKLVLGIGLNVNQTLYADDLSTAGSLRLFSESQNPIEREKLLAKILIELERRLDIWEMRPESVRMDANRRLIGFGCYGTIEKNGSSNSDRYKFMGVNHDGFPTFLTADADIVTFRSDQVRFVPDKGPCDPM